MFSKRVKQGEAILIFTILSTVLFAAGTITQSSRTARQYDRPDGTTHTNWPEQEGYRRHDVVIVCDAATSSASGAIPVANATTTATFVGALAAVVTSPTATVTNLWDFQLLTDHNIDLLTMVDNGTTTVYGANRSNSLQQLIQFRYPIPIVGALKPTVTNTTGTIHLSLYFKVR